MKPASELWLSTAGVIVVVSFVTLFCQEPNFSSPAVRSSLHRARGLPLNGQAVQRGPFCPEAHTVWMFLFLRSRVQLGQAPLWAPLITVIQFRCLRSLPYFPLLPQLEGTLRSQRDL